MAAKDATLPVQVFISYAREDRAMAKRLYADLQQAGVKPWLDVENLLPGQRWKIMIDQAIRQSSYIIALLSSHSISKRGFVQKELKKALDMVEELPPQDVLLIPVRLDACEPQDELLRELHWVDLFPSYQDGLARILRVLTPISPCPPQQEEEEPFPPSETFDVFLCHNSQDKPVVRQIGAHLKQHGLKPWIDVEQLRPGRPWQNASEEQITQIKAVAVCVGPNGPGPWQDLEMQAFIRQFVKRNCPVIPVILPDCKDTPALPPFLDGMMWVDFRTSDPDPLQQLIWGITGERSFTAPPQPASQPKQQSPEKAPKTPVISLRCEPMAVPEEEFQKIFGLDGNWRPREYITNQFEDQGEVVVDHATGLMWQKSGSEDSLTYPRAQDYIDQLNRKRFADYEDWRLPTIPELMSLLEPKKQENGLYINSLFNENQRWCWSSDKRSSSGSAWPVRFNLGDVDWYPFYYVYCVRAVRSRQ